MQNSCFKNGIEMAGMFSLLNRKKRIKCFCMINWDNMNHTLTNILIGNGYNVGRQSLYRSKLAVTASFFLTDLFNMTDRTDPCTLSNQWSSLFKVTFSALAFLLPLEITFSFLPVPLFIYHFSTFFSFIWSTPLKDNFSLKETWKNTRIKKSQTHVLFYVVELWHSWVTYLGTYERTVRVKKVKTNLFKLILNSGKNINALFQILFTKELMITTAISFLNQNPLICIKG